MRISFLCCLAVIVFSGCTSGTFQVPKQEYQARVQVLGVLPVLIDRNSPTGYPAREPLFDLLSRSVADRQSILAERLRQKKGYFDVRVLNVNPELIALSLLSAGNTHDVSGSPLGYRFDRETVSALSKQNVVDALLVVVLSAEQIEQTRRSRTMLESLKTRYDDIVATAAVIDREGQILWQLAGEEAFPLVTLQYADFDEAYYNKTDLVKLKNISLSGIEKTLDEVADDQDADGLPEKIDQLFKRIVSSISPGLLDSMR